MKVDKAEGSSRGFARRDVAVRDQVKSDGRFPLSSRLSQRIESGKVLIESRPLLRMATRKRVLIDR